MKGNMLPVLIFIHFDTDADNLQKISESSHLHLNIYALLHNSFYPLLLI